MTLAKLYGLNVTVIERNSAGTKHEEGYLQPQSAGDRMNWVLGHFVATRNQIMKLIGENPVRNETEAGPYKRGSKTLTDLSSALPLKKFSPIAKFPWINSSKFYVKCPLRSMRLQLLKARDTSNWRSYSYTKPIMRLSSVSCAVFLGKPCAIPQIASS
jgi:hypothetical protein